MISPDREQAREWARDELAKPAYSRGRESPVIRAIRWLLDQLDRVANATGLGSGGLLALILVVALLTVLVIVLVRRNVRLSPAARQRPGAVLGGSSLSGAAHRQLARAALDAGRYDEAVREWMRAMARRLDERGLLDPRPGRTADEIATAAGRLLPDLAAALAAGARTFDDVTYGSVRADRERAEQLRRLDESVEAARPAHLAGGPVLR